MCAGAPCGVISELLLCCSLLGPNRPHADYLAIASAARRAASNRAGRVLVIDAGDLFCLARLERVVETMEGSNLTAVLGVIDVCRTETIDSLCDGVRLAYAAVAGGRCSAVFMHGLAGMFRTTHCRIRRVMGVLKALDTMAGDFGACVMLVNQVHERDGDLFYTGPGPASSMLVRKHLVGFASANVVLVRSRAQAQQFTAMCQNWVDVDGCEVEAGGSAAPGRREPAAAGSGTWALLHRLAFPKKTGEALQAAIPFAHEVYEGCYGPGVAPPPGNRSRRAGSYLHFELHSVPDDRWRWPRLAAMAGAFGCWLWLYPRETKLRSAVCALVYSFMESAFTAVERGARYTSLAQFGANLLYIPVLLDGYGWLLEGQPAHVYVLLFPINVWVLELVVDRLLVLAFGRNVAWCYLDYADELCGGCVRLGHAPAWWLLAVIVLLVDPALRDMTQAMACNADRDLGRCIHTFRRHGGAAADTLRLID